MTSRRKFFFAAAGASAVAAADFVLYEPISPLVETKRVPVFGGLGRQPVRLVQLTDLHLSWSVTPEMIRHAFELALAARPDLVCLTGDFVTRLRGTDVSCYPELFRMLSSRVPTYAVKGNHDGGRWYREHIGESQTHQLESAIEAGGVQMLHNRAELLRIHGLEFWLSGVGDLWNQEIDAARTWAPIPPREMTVVMAHNPDSKDVLSQQEWKLMLSGHTHGSQTSLPFVRQALAPVEDNRFIAGLVPWPEAPGGARWIHTSRGVGNLWGVRILCRPEVSVLELV